MGVFISNTKPPSPFLQVMDFLKSFSKDPVNWMMFMPPPATYENDLPGMFWVPGADKYQGDIPCTLHQPMNLRNPSEPPPYILIYAHGNAMDLGQCTFLDELALHLGIYCIALDYNGYGLATHKNLVTTEASASKDIYTVYQFVRKELNWPAERIILYGQSIGSGIAACCAHRAQKDGENIMGLFLHSGYTCIRDVAVSFVGFLGNFILNRFNTKQRLKELKCPILLTHGDMDEVIPYNMSQIMYEYYQGNELKIFHTAEGKGHNNMEVIEDLAIPFSTMISQIETYRQHANIPIGEAPRNVDVSAYTSKSHL